MDAGATVGIVIGLIAISLLMVIIILVSFRVYNVSTARLYNSKTRMDGKVVLITGATAGIGKMAAMDLAGRGARVIMACRNVEKAEVVTNEIIDATGNSNIVIHYLDTSKLSSVREFARIILDTEEKLDVLILNAGISGYNKFRETEDKIEITMATNHFGHFLLTVLLLRLMVKSAPSRIISISSGMNYGVLWLDPEEINIPERKFGIMKSYAISKACNIMLCGYLGPILQKHNVTVNSMDPGLVKTDILVTGDAWFFITKFLHVVGSFIYRTPEQGVATMIYLAIDEKVKEVTGKYFTNYKITTPARICRNKNIIEKVWKKSEEVVNLTEEERSTLKELMEQS